MGQIERISPVLRMLAIWLVIGIRVAALLIRVPLGSVREVSGGA